MELECVIPVGSVIRARGYTNVSGGFEALFGKQGSAGLPIAVTAKLEGLTGASRIEKGPFPPDQFTVRFSHCAGAVYVKAACAPLPQIM